MKFKNLSNNIHGKSFRDVLFEGVSADGTLYVPEYFPVVSKSFIENLSILSLEDIAFEVMQPFLTELPEESLKHIINRTFNFTIPLTKLQKNIFLLELFHGPTLAFKDVGARFMAEMLSYFLAEEGGDIIIAVATSGDTGSAVAHGFYNTPHVEAYILYPSNKVSPLQEKQMTTLGKNIHAIEVKGSFDDCQHLVKQTLVDNDLKQMAAITTANSINLARLLPQIVYYFWAVAQIRRQQGSHVLPSMVVPSGNFGNITAAAYAKKMGAPIKNLLAATNSNDMIPRYLSTGKIDIQPAKVTLSNAMDVGNPNNFPRLQALYDYDYSVLRQNIQSLSINDEQTFEEIKLSYTVNGKLLDPHTAVGVVAAKMLADTSSPIIIAATAHPAKFPEVIAQALPQKFEIPEALFKLLNKEKKSILMDKDFSKWKQFLVSELR